MRTALTIVVCLTWATCADAADVKPDPAVFADRLAFAGDFDALYTEMKVKHPDLYRLHSKAEWEARYTAVKTAIPRLDWPHYVVALHQFVAMAGDGHTNLLSDELAGPGFDTRYTVRFGLFADGLYLISGSEDVKQAIGGRVIAVNGHPIAEVERALAGLTGHDSPMWAANWVQLLLTYSGNLAGLDMGSVDAPMKLTLAMRDGKAIVASVSSATGDNQPKRFTIFDVLHNGHALPPWWSQDEPLTFEYRKDTRTVYAVFAHVSDGTKEPLKQIADRMFAFISANDVQRLIIDVRQNGGGDNTLLPPMIDGARASKVNHPGGLYVVIGRQTFSAAQNFVSRMENSTQALFVGEPTGESPNQNGEPEFYHLPRTMLPVLISTKRWQDSAADDHRIWTMPDIPARLTFDDFVNGRDLAVEAALAYDASKVEPVADLSKRWMRPSQRENWPPLIPADQPEVPDPSN